jgi:hypothetical protein
MYFTFYLKLSLNWKSCWVANGLRTLMLLAAVFARGSSHLL